MVAQLQLANQEIDLLIWLTSARTGGRRVMAWSCGALAGDSESQRVTSQRSDCCALVSLGGWMVLSVGLTCDTWGSWAPTRAMALGPGPPLLMSCLKLCSFTNQKNKYYAAVVQCDGFVSISSCSPLIF